MPNNSDVLHLPEISLENGRSEDLLNPNFSQISESSSLDDIHKQCENSSQSDFQSASTSVLQGILRTESYSHDSVCQSSSASNHNPSKGSSCKCSQSTSSQRNLHPTCSVQKANSSIQTYSSSSNSSSPEGIKDDSFCKCTYKLINQKHPILTCECGEEDDSLFWTWEKESASNACKFSDDERTVNFHPRSSCGTAVVRGSHILDTGQNFWEIKMTTSVYGTDMMVGVGSRKIDINMFKQEFRSFLGHDCDSWGLSYMGNIIHCGNKEYINERFSQGSIIGVYLDSWNGTLRFYKNRKLIEYSL